MSNPYFAEKALFETVESEKPVKRVTFVVDLRSRSKFHSLLQHCKILPVSRKFTIDPLVIGTCSQIAAILSRTETGTAKPTDVGQAAMLGFDKYANDIATVIALAIRNYDKKPSPRMIRWILQNFSADELTKTLEVVIAQMNYPDFIRSLVLAKGISFFQNN